VTFTRLDTLPAYRATWTEIHGVTPFDRSITFVATGGGGTLAAVYSLVKEYLKEIWVLALSSEVVILNLGVTELLSGTVLGEAAPGIHGLQSGPPVADNGCIVMFLDSEYSHPRWNQRLYRRGTAESLVDDGRLTLNGKKYWALVAAATCSLFLDTDGESYHQFVLVADGKYAAPAPEPGIPYVTPVAWVRIGSILVKPPPF
jgi:hypothetical protein